MPTRDARALTHAGVQALAATALLVICVLPIGCARSTVTIDAARDAFYCGDLPKAEETLAQLIDSRSRESDVAQLDAAIVDLAAGQPAAAITRLRELRTRFDALPPAAPLAEAKSIITDDRTRMFRPAGYQQVLIDALLSLASLQYDAVDAEAYALQAIERQHLFERTAAESDLPMIDDEFQPIALAPYVRGVLREATHHDYDDAARQYQWVSHLRPDFAPAAADVARAVGGVHSRPGNGVLYLFALVGRGPRLVPTDAPVTSTALSIASSVINAETNRDDDDDRGRVGGVVLPNIASVLVPAVQPQPSSIGQLSVLAGGRMIGATQSLMDIESLATRQIESEMPMILARAVLRRVAKEAAVSGVTDALGLDGQAGSLTHWALASTWAGTEKPDTRCWGLLPREIQVFRMELPAGSHRLALQPIGFDRQPTGPAGELPVSIRDGENTYRLAVAMDGAIYTP